MDGIRHLKMTHEEHEAGIQKLKNVIRAEEERRGKKFRRVWGLPRGGIGVALWLSHHCGLELQLTEPHSYDSDLVIAEDIIDTGKTIREFKQVGFFIVALYITTWTPILPDGYAFVKDDKKCFVDFLWETRESAKYDGTLKGGTGAKG